MAYFGTGIVSIAPLIWGFKFNSFLIASSTSLMYCKIQNARCYTLATKKKPTQLYS